MNGAVLTIAQIIKSVMVSAVEAELTAIYITAKNMVPMRHTLVEMGLTQPKYPIQTDNSTAVGFTNKTIINKSIKSFDLKLWWLRDRESQYQFNYYWYPGLDNEGDYSTKHHPPIYHMMKRRNKYMV